MKLPVSTVKARFKSLREKYRHEISILKSLERSGAPANTRPPWSLMSHFKFMMDHAERRQTTSNIEQHTEQQTEEVEASDSQLLLEDVDIDEISIVLDESVNEPLLAVSPAMSQKSNVSEVPSTSSDKYSASSKRKQKACNKEAVLEIDSVLRNVSNAVTSIVHKEPQTKLDYFCNYLRAELHDFPLEDAELFMDEVTGNLLQYKQQLRHKKLRQC